MCRAILLCRPLLLPSASIARGVSTKSQTVSESQLFVFPCSSPSADILPTWIINETHYFPSELPPNYYINATGLVGVATTDLNQTTFQCVIVTVTLSGGLLNVDEMISIPPAVLAGIESGKRENCILSISMLYRTCSNLLDSKK